MKIEADAGVHIQVNCSDEGDESDMPMLSWYYRDEEISVVDALGAAIESWSVANREAYTLGPGDSITITVG